MGTDDCVVFWFDMWFNAAPPKKKTKKNILLGEFSQICLPTHPRVFVRFGRTKGEIQVEKGDFQADLGGFEWFGPCLGISQVNIFQQGSLLFVIKI